MSLIHDVNQAQFCDGYIFSGHNYSESAFDECKKYGKPMALFGSCDDENIDCIDTDNVKTARKIVSYLIDNGHRKIAVVLNNIEADYVNQRYEGYAEALNEAGIEVDPSLVFTVENSIDGGGDAVSLYLSAEKQASAVFLITDIMAWPCRQEGKRFRMMYRSSDLTVLDIRILQNLKSRQWFSQCMKFRNFWHLRFCPVFWMAGKNASAAL